MEAQGNIFGYSARAKRTVEQPITYLMAAAFDRPEVISLAAGFVDYETLPAKEVLELTQGLLEADDFEAKSSLQYGTTQGHRVIREVLLDHMCKLDGVSAEAMGVTADDVVVTTGSQQFLYLLTDVLIDPGDIVITAWPSYFVYTGALQTFGARVRCVDTDEGGMDPRNLGALLEELSLRGELSRVKMVYLVDYHQNPTGITLAEERRREILEVVKKYSRRLSDEVGEERRILILEDAAYRELTYEGEAPGSIKRWDEGNEYVALAQTVSKPFSPGLKMGYALVPSELVDPILLQKGNHDFGSANFTGQLVMRAMREGVYERHVKLLCERYAAKRDAMLEALEEEFGGDEGVTWTRPTGGLYIWLRLEAGMDARFGGALFEAAMDEGMIYVPGAFCYSEDEAREVPIHEMRLSFGVAEEDAIREGIRRLGRAVRGVRAKAGGAVA